MSRIPIGRLAGIFGIHGAVKCDPTSAGRTLFTEGAVLELESAGVAREVRLRHVRSHGKRVVLSLEGVDNADAARRLAGATFYAAREAIHLKPGEFLDSELIGFTLCDSHGRALGTIGGIEHYPASDMLIVDGHMVPFVSAFVRDVDIERQRIVVDLPPGLIEGSAAEA